MKRSYEGFHWKKNILYFGKTPWARIVPNRKYSRMYHIEWFMKTFLEGEFFSKTRAKDNAQRIAAFLSNTMPPGASEKPTGALKTEIGTEVALPT